MLCRINHRHHKTPFFFLRQINRRNTSFFCIFYHSPHIQLYLRNLTWYLGLFSNCLFLSGAVHIHVIKTPCISGMGETRVLSSLRQGVNSSISTTIIHSYLPHMFVNIFPTLIQYNKTVPVNRHFLSIFRIQFNDAATTSSAIFTYSIAINDGLIALRAPLLLSTQ